VRDVHNLYLAHAAELGLVGGGLWVLALLMAIGTALRRRGPPGLGPWRLGLIAVAVSWMVAAATNPQTFLFPTLLLWVWAGVVYGASRQPGEGGDGPDGPWAGGAPPPEWDLEGLDVEPPLAAEHPPPALVR
jgi:O-antigen ligase